MSYAVKETHVVIAANGIKNMLTVEHYHQRKDKVIVGNIGHFDNEIDVAWLKQNAEEDNIKPQVDIFRLKENGNEISLLSQGRLMNLGNAAGHPSFVMSNSFTNQTLARIALRNEPHEV